MTPGDLTTLKINHGDRPARVLAIRNGRLLLEYEMPRGSTALRFLTPTANGFVPSRAGYYGLSTLWLTAIAEAEQEWIGHPQGCAPVPTVASLVAHRQARRSVRP